MTVTIKDVATRAGVSAKTVSRVMNGEQHVRPEVAERVRAAVAALGYRPNAFARSLSSARTYLIGLFFDDPASGYATAMQRGALAACRARHYHLIVEPLDLDEADWLDKVEQTVRSLRLDGVILPPPLSQNRRLLDRLDALAARYVTVSPDRDDRRAAAALEIDERQAAIDMTRYLIGLGHRDIGFVEGDPLHSSASLRRAGFAAAMAAAGLPVAAERVLPGDFSFRSGFAAGEALLGRNARPSAVFASNDDMALGVCVAAMKLGIAIPGDLSVVGFDDAATARLAWPPITTVRQPVAELGEAAVAMLVDGQHPARDGAPRLRRLDYTIIERASSAAPAIQSGRKTL